MKTTRLVLALLGLLMVGSLTEIGTTAVQAQYYRRGDYGYGYHSYRAARGYYFGSSYYGAGRYGRPWGYSSPFGYAPGFGSYFGSGYYSRGFGYSYYGGYCR